MAEWKKIGLKISSVIYELSDNDEPFGEPEINEEIYSSALVRKTAGGFEAEYEISAEGITDKCALYMGGDTVKMTRAGQVRSELVFEKGKSHSTLYVVSSYSFDMTVTTKAIECDVDDEGTTLWLEYNMCLGGQKRSVKMKIEVRGSL